MYKVLKTYKDKYSHKIIKSGVTIEVAPDRLKDFVEYEKATGTKVLEEVKAPKKKRTKKKATSDGVEK